MVLQNPSAAVSRGRPFWPPGALLGRLADADRERLLRLGHDVYFPAREILIREAEDSGFVLILLGGTVKATAHALDGREVLLAVRMAGDLVGEFGGIDGQPRSATVTACGKVRARQVRSADFQACLQQHPAIAMAVNQAVVAKMRTATGRIVDVAGCRVATRLARMVHQLAVAYGRPGQAAGTVKLPLSQSELATLVSASQSAVEKALSDLRLKGIVVTGYGTIVVLDIGRLAEAAFGQR